MSFFFFWSCSCCSCCSSRSLHVSFVAKNSGLLLFLFFNAVLLKGEGRTTWLACVADFLVLPGPVTGWETCRTGWRVGLAHLVLGEKKKKTALGGLAANQRKRDASVACCLLSGRQAGRQVPKAGTSESCVGAFQQLHRFDLNKEVGVGRKRTTDLLPVLSNVNEMRRQRSSVFRVVPQSLCRVFVCLALNVAKTRF